MKLNEATKLFVLVVTVVATASINLSMYTSEVLAASTQPEYRFRTVYSAGDCKSLVTSVVRTDLTATDKDKAAMGYGIDGNYGGLQGTGYLSSKLYHCCFEQTAKGNNPVSCANVTLDQRAGDKDPWIASSNGSVYYKFGQFPNKAATTGVFSGANAPDGFSSEYVYSTGMQQANLSNTSRLSASSMVLLNYADASVNPPALSGFKSWYSYLKRTVEVNGFTITSSNVSSWTGKVKTKVGKSEAIYEITPTGGVFTLDDVECDGKYLTFVNGSLVINPKYDIAAANLSIDKKVGCMYVVKGNVTIGTTANTANRINVDSTSYDLIRAAIISDGFIEANFVSNVGLKVEGLLAGSGANYQRQLVDNQYPSVWVEYDPRYAELFKNELKITRFSTREKGFVPGL
jgi:hypothetical protein